MGLEEEDESLEEERKSGATSTSVLKREKKKINIDGLSNAISSRTTIEKAKETRMKEKDLVYGAFLATTLFEKSQDTDSSFGVGKAIPDFLPVNVSEEVGMSPWKPYVYEGG